MSDERIERVDRHEEAEYRSAGENAALGIAAFMAVRPYIDKAASKLTGPKDSKSPVEIPPGTVKPDKG